MICAAGKNSGELYDALCRADNSSIKKHKVISGQEFFAASVDMEALDAENIPADFDSKLLRLENTALNQIKDTIETAVKKYGAEKIGVCLGSCDNLTELSCPAHNEYFTSGKFNNYSIEKQSAQYAARFIKDRFCIKGPCSSFSTACSSSAGAIIKAVQLLKSGICDAVIAGGVDIASDTALMGFGSLEAISPEPTNPFSKNRHGITMGEAAAFFLLSREDLDGTGISIAGYGESADAYHITSPNPEGSGAAAAMEAALKSAGMTAKDIGYLNLHGTGTKFNDSMEAKAVSQIFADYQVPCSSTKGTTGHTLGAAGALELAVCYEVLQASKNNKTSLPAQHWDKVQDETLPPLNIVNAGSPCQTEKIQACMSSSFAFGGSNTALIIKKD